VLELIEEEGIDRPVVAGFFLEGTQVGLRLALDPPDRIRGVVLLAGSAGRVQPGQSYTLEQRVRYQDEQMAPNWFRTVTLRTWNDNSFPPSSYSRARARGQRLFEQVSGGPLPVFIRYLLEFWASDLPAELAAVGVPVLVLSPDFAPELLEDEATRWLSYYFVDSWEVAADVALVERRVVEDAHAFLWLDQPAAVQQALRSFVASLASPPASTP
jgi:pimeloyl-ACP methyl ester carboxylesterase